MKASAGWFLTRASVLAATLYALSLGSRMWNGPVGRDLEARCGRPLSLFMLLVAWVVAGVFLEIAAAIRETRGPIDRDAPRQEWARTLGGLGVLLVVVSMASASAIVAGIVWAEPPLPLLLCGAIGAIGASWTACAELVSALAARGNPTAPQETPRHPAP